MSGRGYDQARIKATPEPFSPMQPGKNLIKYIEEFCENTIDLSEMAEIKKSA
jgi:hypothetical protein